MVAGLGEAARGALLDDAVDALAHLGAERVDAAGGFEVVRVRVSSGSGEILCGLGDGSEAGWSVIDETGKHYSRIAGEFLVEFMAALCRAADGV